MLRGAGTGIITVLAVNGAGGEVRGIIGMRLAAVGSIGAGS